MRTARSPCLHCAMWMAALLALCPAVGVAQSTPPSALAPVSSPEPATVDGRALLGPAAFEPTTRGATEGGFWAPFRAIPRDFAGFFSADALMIIGVASAGAVAAHRWDDGAADGSREHLRPGLFGAGNAGGQFLVQAGASVGLYSIARLAGAESLAALGSDLVRAQVLAQGVVQAGKFATRRQRPDGSNNHSLPSGHTAAAFAGAAVLTRHLGWKAGVPAYGFGAYVAASRMSASKHHLSDVIVGAAVGIAAARAVRVGTGRARFDMGVTPTAGGAAITFRKH